MKNIEQEVVAICRHVPEWYTGRTYMKLAPTETLLRRYKSGALSELEFTAEYIETTLNLWDARKVWRELTHVGDVVLLCYESAGKFCHRREVSKWFKRELGKDVAELGQEYPTLF